MPENPYQSPAHPGAEHTSGQDTCSAKGPPFDRRVLMLWAAGIVFPSAIVWLAGLARTLNTIAGIGSPSFPVPWFHLVLVLLISALWIWIGMVKVKLRRFAVWGVVGSVLMIASLGTSWILVAAILRYLGV
jgi:hypothetical protein